MGTPSVGPAGRAREGVSAPPPLRGHRRESRPLQGQICNGFAAGINLLAEQPGHSPPRPGSRADIAPPLPPHPPQPAPRGDQVEPWSTLQPQEATIKGSTEFSPSDPHLRAEGWSLKWPWAWEGWGQRGSWGELKTAALGPEPDSAPAAIRLRPGPRRTLAPPTRPFPGTWTLAVPAGQRGCQKSPALGSGGSSSPVARASLFSSQDRPQLWPWEGSGAQTLGVRVEGGRGAGRAGVEAAQPRPTPTFPITKALWSPALSLLLPLQLLTKWHQGSKSLLQVQGQKPISKQLEPRQTFLAPFSSQPLGLWSQGSRVELACRGQFEGGPSALGVCALCSATTSVWGWDWKPGLPVVGPATWAWERWWPRQRAREDNEQNPVRALSLNLRAGGSGSPPSWGLAAPCPWLCKTPLCV